MTNLVPGLLWRPVDVGNRSLRAKGRGLIGHVAVSSSTMLFPGPVSTRQADWTFYLPKVGPGIQMIDLDLQCWASGAGNATCPAFESEGGLGTAAQVDAEPWSPDQIESAAMILAHLHRTEGTPLQVMPDSLASSRGLAPHRWGIDPWRVSRGEVWSSHYAKQCPGVTKISQLPSIVRRAQQLVTPEGDVPVLDSTDLINVYKAVWLGPAGGPLLTNRRSGHGEWPETTLEALEVRLRDEILPPLLQPLRDELVAIAAKPAGTVALSDTDKADIVSGLVQQLSALVFKPGA